MPKTDPHEIRAKLITPPDPVASEREAQHQRYLSWLAWEQVAHGANAIQPSFEAWRSAAEEEEL